MQLALLISAGVCGILAIVLNNARLAGVATTLTVAAILVTLK